MILAPRVAARKGEELGRLSSRPRFNPCFHKQGREGVQHSDGATPHLRGLPNWTTNPLLLATPAGTSASTSMSLLLEPAFVSKGTGDHGQDSARPPLYFALPNCSALSEDDAATLHRIGEVRG